VWVALILSAAGSGRDPAFARSTARRSLAGRRVPSGILRRYASARRTAALVRAVTKRVLDGWNETATPYEREASVPELFERQARDDPQAVAVESGSRLLSYQELDDASNRLAHRLREEGVGTDVRVAVAAERSIEAVVAFLGVLKAGGAYVPLDPYDPADRLEFILRDTDACVTVVQRDLVDRMPSAASRLVTLGPDFAEIAGQKTGPVAGRPGARDLVYVMYTSGSTGRPKGVAVEHRGVVRYMRGAQTLMPRRGEGMLHVNELDFDAATFEIWGALLNGARLVVHPAGPREPTLVGRTIRDHGVAVAGPVTGLFHQLVDGALGDLAGLRLVVVGGDVLSPSHAMRFLEAYPDARLVNDYGPTEGTVSSSWHEVDPTTAHGPVPIGRPLANTRLYILDEAGQPVAAGEPGELWIGGDGVARGYLNLPEETAARFLPDPFTTESDARMYATGDRVHLRPDGELAFVGRIDNQVKVRGYRVEPAEVEVHLRACPAVADAAVIAREDVSGHVRLVAYVVPGEGFSDCSAAARQFLDRALPPHMVPSAFVTLDRLPLTPSGKVDRAALPAPTDAPRRHPSRSPKSRCEEELLRIWREVLHVDDVRVEDDFLELGGDSLLALQILVRLREGLGVDLPIDSVFRSRSVERLAVRVEEQVGAGQRPAFGPINPVRDGRDIPASLAQQQACFEAGLADDALPYQFQALIHLKGSLNVGALEQALTEIIRRHEIMRTRFPRRDGTWWQIVEAPFAVTLPVVDLRGKRDPDSALDHLVQEAFHTVIPVDRLPLTRWTLARVSDNHHVLIHVEHHVVHDGWSWTVFLRELVDLYGSSVEGQRSALAEPSIQFRDFTAWQLELVGSEIGRRQLDYWTRQLANLPSPLALPTDRPRPARSTYRGDELVVELPTELADRLRTLSRESGVTLYMTMLAAFYVVLRSYGGQEDIVVGSGVSNRRLRQTEDLVGMVLNTVALRADLSGNQTVRQLLEHVRTVTLEAYAHQDVPYEQVVEHLAPKRRPGFAPVYQVLFSFHDTPFPSMRAPGVTITADDTPGNGSAKADLNIVVINRRTDGPDVARPGELTVIWEFSTDLFEPETAEGMLASYRAVLEAFVEQPTQQINDVHVLDESRRRQLIAEAGASVAYERHASIVEVFGQRVLDDPEAPAIVADGVTLTYRALNHRANRLAHRLLKLDVRRQDRVAILAERAPATIVAILAVLKAGGAYVVLDPSLPRARLQLLLEDTEARVVCVDPRWGDRLPSGPWPVLSVNDVTIDAELADEPEIEIAATDLAYVMYTSGSTGTPKGVEVPHRAVVRLVRGVDYVDLDPRETLLQMAPLSFDASTFEIWGALLNGARLAIAPAVPLAPAEIGELIERFGVTTLWLTAGLFHQFVDQCPDGVRRVRQLVAGGDVLSPSHVASALRLLPRDGVLVNGYGPTEGTTFTCCHRMAAGSRVSGPIPIGRPIANTRVHILDKRGEQVAPGTSGELYIGGDGLARGYLGRPDLTEECFVPDDLGPDPDARLYKTGDLGRRRSDGIIEFQGRVDRQVKIRGFRVEPAEVEHALIEHPAVRDAVVVARVYGPDDRRLVAYITAADPEAPIAGLRAYLAERLPVHELPGAWVTLERLPLTENGKVDRAALPAPPTDRTDAPLPSRSLGRIERKMIEIWEETLEVGPIGLDDDFFELGGHSLLAVDLFATIQRILGPRLPLASIFEAPTVGQLADVVRREGWEAPWSSLVTLNPSGSRTPFFCVAAGDGNTVGFGALARHLSPDQPFYALQPRGLDGRRLLQTSVTAMARHYVRAVRTVQPTGPYLLGGRCLGALVAYEMARQLETDGQEVTLLAILDSLGPHWKPRLLSNGFAFDPVMNLALLRARSVGVDFGDVFAPPGTNAFIAWLREPVIIDEQAVSRYLFEAYQARPDVQRAYPNVPGQDVVRLIDWGWISGRREMGMHEELLPTPSAWASALRLPNASRMTAARVATRAGDWIDVATRGRLPVLAARRERRLQAIALEAAARYRAAPYQGRITLIRSEEYLGNVEIARWHGLATGGVEERLTAGTHRSMLREPDVGAVADCLEGCIDDATRDTIRTSV
jgi:amino acid adenylation domain-containing protein